VRASAMKHRTVLVRRVNIAVQSLLMSIGVIVVAYTSFICTVPDELLAGTRRQAVSIVQRSETTGGVDFTAQVAVENAIQRHVHLTLIAANKTSAPVHWGEIDGYRDCVVTVYDKYDNPVPFTKLGSLRLAKPGDSIYRQVFKQIAPGQSQSWNYNLSELFELVPGEFTVSAFITMNMPKGFELSVERLRFSVE
jgi:hypothetical protein